jgi:hypothetical protein
MAKKPQILTPLTITEIILRGDADTIRQALEARTQIDTLLEEREAAYQLIAELETQVCEIIGEDGVFPFPEPPMPIAEFVTSTKAKKAVTKLKPTVVTPEASESTEPEPVKEPEPAVEVEVDEGPTKAADNV